MKTGWRKQPIKGHEALKWRCIGHLTFPKQALVFQVTCLQYRSFENTVGKGEIAHNELDAPGLPMHLGLFSLTIL